MARGETGYIRELVQAELSCDLLVDVLAHATKCSRSHAAARGRGHSRGQAANRINEVLLPALHGKVSGNTVRYCGAHIPVVLDSGHDEYLRYTGAPCRATVSAILQQSKSLIGIAYYYVSAEYARRSIAAPQFFVPNTNFAFRYTLKCREESR
jgi:hypothetical protein